MIKSESVVAGKSDESELVERLISDELDFRMPPKGNRLSVQEVARLRAWIDQGLSWVPGFTFQNGGYVAPLKLRRIELPPVRNGREQPIDRILDAYWTLHKVSPPAPLDDRAFVRRVYLDCVWSAPQPEALTAFLEDRRRTSEKRWFGGCSTTAAVTRSTG